MKKTRSKKSRDSIPLTMPIGWHSLRLIKILPILTESRNLEAKTTETTETTDKKTRNFKLF
jgi:hypothetical protein